MAWSTKTWLSQRGRTGSTSPAWYIPADTSQAPEDRPALVMVHGWNASRTNAFNQRFLELAQALHQAGNSVLMIDLRGHGQKVIDFFGASLR